MASVPPVNNKSSIQVGSGPNPALATGQEPPRAVAAVKIPANGQSLPDKTSTTINWIQTRMENVDKCLVILSSLQMICGVLGIFDYWSRGGQVSPKLGLYLLGKLSGFDYKFGILEYSTELLLGFLLYVILIFKGTGVKSLPCLHIWKTFIFLAMAVTFVYPICYTVINGYTTPFGAVQFGSEDIGPLFSLAFAGILHYMQIKLISCTVKLQDAIDIRKVTPEV